MKKTVERLSPAVKPVITDERYTRLFSRKESTAASLKSGAVSLRPGENIGEHSTEDKEEIIIVLEGRGLLKTGNKDSYPFQSGSALYVPPATKHDVKNTGSKNLRYVYVTAPVCT